MATDFCTVHEKMSRLRTALQAASPQVERSLTSTLDISWIYHDCALEGELVDSDEILAAIEGRPPVTGSTEQVSVRIRALKAGLEAARRETRARKEEVDMALLKKLHGILSPDPDGRGGRYRRSMPSHRTFFHEIARPSRISYMLRKLFAWLESEEARRQHPIHVAAEIHYRLITIGPFEDYSGPVARLFSTAYLLSRGYMPAIIHAQDRQRYYESFVAPTSEDLAILLAESLSNGCDSSLRFLEQRSEGSRTSTSVA
jgi:Fic family protein